MSKRVYMYIPMSSLGGFMYSKSTVLYLNCTALYLYCTARYSTVLHCT